MKIVDSIESLNWRIANIGATEEACTARPTPLRDRMVAAKAAEKESAASTVVDLRARGRKGGKKPAPVSPRAQAIRDRVAKARAANAANQ